MTMANLDVCKLCQHCAVFNGNPQHHVFHCGLSKPVHTPHGLAFTGENPTNIIGEDIEEPVIDPSTKRRTFVRAWKPKALFKIPAACPSRGKHGG